MAAATNAVVDAVGVLQASGVRVPETTASQYLLAVVVAVAAVLAALYVYYRLEYVGLDQGAASAPDKLALVVDKAFGTPDVYRFPAADDPAEHYAEIEATVAASVRPSAASPDPSVREASRGLREQVATMVDRSLAAVSGGRLGVDLTRIPQGSRRLLELALAAVVFGALANEGERMAVWLERASGRPSLSSVVDELASATTTSLETAVDVVLLFPYGETIWALVFSYSILFAEWLWGAWWLLAAVLVVLAVVNAVAGLRREQTGAADRVELLGYGETMLYSALGVGGLWLVGVVPATALRLAGYPLVGAAWGLVDVALCTAGLAVYAAWDVWNRIRWTAASADGRRDRVTVAVSIITRRVGAVLSGVALAFVASWALVTIVGGQLAAVLAAYLAAPLGKQLVIGLVLLAPVVWVVWMLREAYPDLRSALADVTARQSLLAKLLGRALPVVAVGVLFILLSEVVGSLWLAAALSVLGGLALHGAWRLIQRAHYRLRVRDQRENAPRRIQVHGYRLEDDHGNVHPLIELNGEVTVAWDSVEATAVAAVLAADDLREDGEVAPMLSREHADDLLTRGITDPEVTRDRVEEQVRKDALVAFYDEGSGRGRRQRTVGADDFTDALAEHPEGVRDRVVEWLEDDAGVLRRRGSSVRLLRDPWSQDG